MTANSIIIEKRSAHMTLYMQKKPSSWPDRFTIKDEFEIDRYFVEGERFTWGKPLHVFDMENREVALVKRKLFAFYPIFEVLTTV